MPAIGPLTRPSEANPNSLASIPLPGAFPSRMHSPGKRLVTVSSSCPANPYRVDYPSDWQRNGRQRNKTHLVLADFGCGFAALRSLAAIQLPDLGSKAPDCCRLVNLNCRILWELLVLEVCDNSGEEHSWGWFERLPACKPVRHRPESASKTPTVEIISNVVSVLTQKIRIEG
jgi:hypothetical protein